MKSLSLSHISNNQVLMSGELNRHSVPTISLPKIARNSTLILDLKQVTEVDTSGLAWLIHTLSQLQRNDISLKLVNIPEQLTKLMQLGDVENLFE